MFHTFQRSFVSFERKVLQESIVWNLLISLEHMPLHDLEGPYLLLLR
jgi:hypothetical protein